MPSFRCGPGRTFRSQGREDHPRTNVVLVDIGIPELNGSEPLARPSVPSPKSLELARGQLAVFPHTADPGPASDMGASLAP